MSRLSFQQTVLQSHVTNFCQQKNINLSAQITGILSIIAYNRPDLFKEINSSVISLSIGVKVVLPTDCVEVDRPVSFADSVMSKAIRYDALR